MISAVRSPRRGEPTVSARIALAHDWLCGYRGGEAVLDRIARLVAARYQPAGLYVMFDDGRPMTPAIDSLRRIASPISATRRVRRWMLAAYPVAVAALSRRLARDHARQPIDLLVSTSSAAIKGLRAPPGVPHLCYCHSPARYVWSQGAEYERGSPLRALGLRLASRPYRAWDARTAARVTTFVANSTHTANEVRRCYGREAVAVFPPVRTEYFTPDPGVRREGFWLFVGALEPYKRADLAIEAARLAGRELVIAGDGSERQRLERAGGGSGDPPIPDRSGDRSHPGRSGDRSLRVRLLGRVSDEALRDLYRRAAVLLFPQIEDFGIVAAEALACGLPVAARRAGGALDTVTENVTGAFFDEPTPAALAAAACAAESADPGACRARAVMFSENRFDAAMAGLIENALAGVRATSSS